MARTLTAHSRSARASARSGSDDNHQLCACGRLTRLHVEERLHPAGVGAPLSTPGSWMLVHTRLRIVDSA